MNVNPSGLDLLGYMDCFVQVVSGSEVIKGIGPYVMIHPNFSHPHRTPSLLPYPRLSDHYH